MAKALLIIDYTNDFVATKGALSAGKSAQDLEPYIVNLANNFLNRNDYVILPTDMHEQNDTFHPESKLFPAHNIKDTWGRKFYGSLQNFIDTNIENKNVYAYAKNHYNSFANTNLDNYLRQRNITQLELVGVCSDICVLHTAIAAYDLNYQVTIHENGIATFTPNGQEWALAHFKNSLGFKVI